MDRCDVAGGLISMGINQLAEKLGLTPLPLGGGDAVDLNPGFLVKRELSLLCKQGEGPSLFNLNLDALSAVAQGYLMDRMEDLASEQQDKKLGIPGNRFASPSFGLGFIGLPGQGSVVIWRDPSKDGIQQLNGFMVRITIPTN
jgi:hypothetical protein